MYFANGIDFDQNGDMTKYSLLSVRLNDDASFDCKRETDVVLLDSKRERERKYMAVRRDSISFPVLRCELTFFRSAIIEPNEINTMRKSVRINVDIARRTHNFHHRKVCYRSMGVFVNNDSRRAWVTQSMDVEGMM